MENRLHVRAWLWVILALGAVTLVLRADSFFHPQIMPQDEALYYRVAKQWLEGTPIYAGDFDHKPPGIYYVYTLAMAVGGTSILAIRWAAVGVSWLAAVALFGLARRLWLLHGAGGVLLQAGALRSSTAAAQTAGWVAGLLYAACSTRMGGYTANTELFFNPFTILCLWGIVEAASRPRLPVGLVLAAGSAGGVACLIKYPVALETALVGGLWLIWMRGGRTLGGMLTGRALAALALLAAGYLLPLAGSALHFALGGRLDVLVTQSVLLNLRHREVTQHKALAYVYYYGRALAEFAPALPGLLWLPFARRAMDGPAQRLMLGWLVGATLSARITGHPFQHYLLEVLPVLCLATGCLAATMAERFVAAAHEAVTAQGLLRARTAWPIAGWLVLLATLPATLAAGEANLGDFVGHMVSWRRTGDIWAADPNYQVAVYMKKHLAPGQLWFGVEASPVAYDLSGHPLPTRYSFWPFLVSGHFEQVTGQNQIAELTRLFALKPRYITLPMPDLDAYFAAGKLAPPHYELIKAELAHYRYVEKIGNAYVFEVR